MVVQQERSRGIKLSLIIFMIVFFSVAATFTLNTIVGYETQKRSLTSNTLDLNRITANELSHTTETILQSMQDTLKSAAVFIAQDDNWEQKTVQQQIDFLRTSVPYFNSVILVNANGVVTTTSPEALNVRGTKLTSAQAQQALKLRKPLISAPYRGVTNRMIVLASYPVFNSKGEYRGFLGGTVYLQEANVFQKLLGNQRINENGSYYYVVDPSGNLIYHPEAKRIGENVADNPAVRSILKGESGQMSLKNTLGKPYLAGFSIVPTARWGIVFQTPTTNVESSVGQVISRMAAISAPLLALLLVLALFVSRRLASPLNRLASAASRLKRGDAGVRDLPEVRSWNFEAKELYHAVSDAFRMLDKKAEDFSFQAHTDTLTSLTNRRRMDAIVEEWIRNRLPFCVIMLDLDRFKSVNDTYGHQKGDEVLRFLADLMKAEVGERGHCCRYGGEEFAILLPMASLEHANELAERIRIRTERAASPIGRPLTLSLGISEFPACAGDAETLFKQADEALYEAKQSGRNRTVVYRKSMTSALQS